MIAGFTFSTDIVKNGKIYSAIVVFNLALCFHLQAMVLGDNKSPYGGHLSKAKSLYRQSFRILEDTVVGCYHGMATGNAAFDLLTMALLNNLAQTQMEFHELVESGKGVFKLLIRYALSVKERDCHPSSPIMTDDINMIQQVDIYLLNAISVVGLPAPEAAAAA
jgi:hypothetical protein